MGDAVVTIKIMPVTPDVDLESLETQAKEKIVVFAGEGQTKSEIEPVAFGLKAIKITFVMDEAKGAIDPLEEEIEKIEGVNSCETIDVRRALG